MDSESYGDTLDAGNDPESRLTFTLKALIDLLY